MKNDISNIKLDPLPHHKKIGERILVVDDDKNTRNIYKLHIQQAGHQIVGEASNGWDAIRLVGSCHPSLMLLDMDMPWMEGLSVLRRLQIEAPWLSVMVLSALDPKIYAIRCMRLGARGYINKGDIALLLKNAIQQIRNGLMLFPQQEGMPDLPWMDLSDRELISLRCIARGGNETSIAAALLIERAQATILCKHLQTKLSLGSIEEVRQFAKRLRLG